MTAITTRIRVASDGTFSGRASGLLPGEHEAIIRLVGSKPRLSVRDMPVHGETWDDGVSLRREDLYGEDGR